MNNFSAEMDERNRFGKLSCLSYADPGACEEGRAPMTRRVFYNSHFNNLHLILSLETNSIRTMQLNNH